jgi:hypothetical protein
VAVARADFLSSADPAWAWAAPRGAYTKPAILFIKFDNIVIIIKWRKICGARKLQKNYLKTNRTAHICIS